MLHSPTPCQHHMRGGSRILGVKLLPLSLNHPTPHTPSSTPHPHIPPPPLSPSQLNTYASQNHPCSQTICMSMLCPPLPPNQFPPPPETHIAYPPLFSPLSPPRSLTRQWHIVAEEEVDGVLLLSISVRIAVETPEWWGRGGAAAAAAPSTHTPVCSANTAQTPYCSHSHPAI